MLVSSLQIISNLFNSILDISLPSEILPSTEATSSSIENLVCYLSLIISKFSEYILLLVTGFQKAQYDQVR